MPRSLRRHPSPWAPSCPCSRSSSPPADIRVPLTFVAVLVALAITGAISARVGESSVSRAVTRLMIGGALAMAFTYAVGLLLGTAGVA